MALKRKDVLSRNDFREAVDSHQISISQVAKATGISRSYLSEFSSDVRRLKPDQQQKIRDYLEGQGVEFDQAPANDDDDSPHPGIAVAQVCHFPLLPDRKGEASTVMQEIESNDTRIAALLKKKAARGEGLFAKENEFSVETEEDLRELFAYAAANYFMFRYLTGAKNPLEETEAGTVQEVVVNTLMDSLKKAGINTKATPAPAPADEELEDA